MLKPLSGQVRGALLRCTAPPVVEGPGCHRPWSKGPDVTARGRGIVSHARVLLLRAQADRTGLRRVRRRQQQDHHAFRPAAPGRSSDHMTTGLNDALRTGSRAAGAADERGRGHRLASHCGYVSYLVGNVMSLGQVEQHQDVAKRVCHDSHAADGDVEGSATTRPPAAWTAAAASATEVTSQFGSTPAGSSERSRCCRWAYPGLAVGRLRRCATAARDRGNRGRSAGLRQDPGPGW